MTAEPANLTPVPEPALALTSRTDTSPRETHFTFDGHPLLARRPKTKWLIDKQGEAAALDEEDPRQIDLLNEVVAKVFPRQEDRDYFDGRLADDDDDFEYEDLEVILTALRERWAGGARPTGRSTGPSRPQPKSGRRSTARRR